MLVTSQLPIQTTKFAIISFQCALVPPTLKKFPPPMDATMGVGAGKFWGIRRVFALIFPNLPKMFLCGFSCKISPTKIMKTFFWYDLQKKVGFSGFARIFDISNLLGVRLHPRLLHHWTQLWVNSPAGADCRRQKLRFKTSFKVRNCSLCEPWWDFATW